MQNGWSSCHKLSSIFSTHFYKTFYKFAMNCSNESRLSLRREYRSTNEIAQRSISRTFIWKAYRQRTTQELNKSNNRLSHLYFHLCAHILFFSILQWSCNVCFFVQTNSKIVTVNHIQSFSINIPHTVMCKLVLLKWIYMAYMRSSAFCFSVQ